MLNAIKQIHPAFETAPAVSMKARQTPLLETYKQDPEQAIVFDFATTDSEKHDVSDPLHSKVFIDQHFMVEQGVSVHRKVGGKSDLPTPGDLLCGAIASCLDSTIRVIANRFDIRLKTLKVSVTGEVDVRGTLRVDRQVPVGFSGFDIEVDIQTAGYLPAKWLDRLLAGAEQSCIIIQSLNPNCNVNITRVR